MATDPQPEDATERLYRVGSLADLRAGKPLKASVGGQKLAAFLVHGAVVVTNGRCPHAAGPLHEGEIEDTILTCPWHGWQWDLRDGSCPEDPGMKLAIHPSHVDGDDIMVRL